MPLTAEQKSAIETLKGVSSEDIDEAAEALKKEAHPLYQKVFRGGHQTAESAYKGPEGKLTKAEAALQAEKERAAALDTELQELRTKAPDRAAIDAQWQNKLAAREKELQAQVESAQAKVAKLTTDTTVEKAENALVAAGFRPRLAKLLAKEHAGRITYGDDGRPVLYEPGTQIPMQIPEGKSAFDVLAESEKKNADPADLASHVDTGGGTGGGGVTGGYDPVAAGKAMAAATKAGDNSLAFK